MVNLSQHHHKDGLSLFSLKPETSKHLPIWFSFPQNLKPTIRSISQRVLDDLWVLVWIRVGVSPFSLSWSLPQRCGVGKWWFLGFGVDQHSRFDLVSSMWVFFKKKLVVVVFCLWVLLMMGLGLRRGGFCWIFWCFWVGFMILELFGCCVCMWTIVCGNEFKSDLSFFFFYTSLIWASVLQGMMTPILWWGYLMESMMTNLGSSVMVHGFSCLGGGFFWVWFEFGLWVVLWIRASVGYGPVVLWFGSCVSCRLSFWWSRWWFEREETVRE